MNPNNNKKPSPTQKKPSISSSQKKPLTTNNSQKKPSVSTIQKKPSPTNASTKPSRQSLTTKPTFVQSQRVQQQQRQSLQITNSTKASVPIQQQQTQKQRKVLDDDEPVEPYVPKQNSDQDQQKEQKNIDDMLKMSIRARFNDISLKQEEQKLPVMLQVCTQDENEQEEQKEEENPEQLQENQEKVKEMVKQSETDKNEEEIDRAPVDLICVIDRSGSMYGQKLELVKNTLLYLVEELLGDNDRLCLVQFDDQAQRITNLRKIGKNKDYFIKVIKGINSGGCTDITKGMNIALNQIGDRKYKNPITSVFLLSDGLDGMAKNGVNNMVTNTKKSICQNNNFTIQSFGYGNDHDSEMMNFIAQLRDGSFYFIENLDQVDEAFVNSLAELFSVLCQNVQLQIILQDDVYQKELFKENSLYISRAYGEMWSKEEEKKKYKINLQQLIKGVSKEYMFELNIPDLEKLLKKPIKDTDRNNLVIKAILTAEENTSNNNQKPKQINQQATLNLNFFEEDIQDLEEDGEVMENYYRVKGAEMIGECITKADQGDLETGNKMIDSFVNEVQNKPKLKKSEKLQKIVQDLQEAKTIMSNKNEFRSKKGKMINMKGGHMHQKAQQFNDFDDDFEDDGIQLKKSKKGYANSMQKMMVSKCKKKKM